MSQESFQAIYAFLVKNGLKKTAKSLLKEKKIEVGIETTIDIETIVKEAVERKSATQTEESPLEKELKENPKEDKAPKEPKELKKQKKPKKEAKKEEPKKEEEELKEESVGEMKKEERAEEKKDKKSSKEEKKLQKKMKKAEEKSMGNSLDKKPKKQTNNGWKGGKFGEHSFNGEKIDRTNEERKAASSYGNVEKIPNAARTLHETKGKGFQKSKTKLKRTDFKGKIDPNAVNSFKFED